MGSSTCRSNSVFTSHSWLILTLHELYACLDLFNTTLSVSLETSYPATYTEFQKRSEHFATIFNFLRGGEWVEPGDDVTPHTPDTVKLIHTTFMSDQQLCWLFMENNHLLLKADSC